MAEKEEDKKKRVTHTPGRDHTHKSGPSKKKRFQKRAKKKREAKQDDLQKQWEKWESLPAEVRKLRPELKPTEPRPTNDT